MCKAKPGPRCVPHVAASLLAAINKVNNNLRDIEALDGAVDNAATRKNLKRKQEALAKAEVKVAGFEIALAETKAERAARAEAKEEEKEAKEQAEIDAQEAKIAEAIAAGRALRGRPKGSKVFTENVTCSYAKADWEDVEIGFIDSGEEDFSKYVRDALDNGVRFEAKGAEAFVADSSKMTHHADENSRGRLPTVTGQNRDIRKDIQFTPEQLAKIEAGAALYRLKRTDYIRRVILGMDMRKSEGHMSKKTYEAREQYFANKEAEAGFDSKTPGATVQAFYMQEWADTMVALRGEQTPGEGATQESPIAAAA
jgi:hypothetical protein